MPPDPDRTVGDAVPAAGTYPDPAAGAVQVLTGKMVSLRFVVSALRRTRRLWLAVGALGLVAGIGYHFVVPVKYGATATLYLAHPAGSASTVEAQNDLAILKAATVADHAIARLGPAGKGLTPSGLLGKAPATITSGNVMTLTLSGPSSSAAVQRVNALGAAYLAFRSHLYQEQNQSVVTATDQQISNLRTQITSLSSQIGALGTRTKGSSQQLANLQAQRGAATSSLLRLEQSVQQSNLDTLSVVHGSRVITPGTIVPTSRKKVLAVDGLTGMAGGLGAAVVMVIMLACLSDRLRRREDVAALVGAPVALSIGGLRRGIFRRSARAIAARREPALLPLVQHFRALVEQSPRHTLLVVAADDPRATAAAVAVVAGALAAQGKHVMVVDETRERSLGRAYGSGAPGIHTVYVGEDDPAITLLVPPRPWEADGSLDPTGEAAAADAVLVVAGVDPGTGAWHLRRWASHAVVSITAGNATARGVAALAELLDAAGIDVPSTVLLGADPDDESAGLPAAAPSTVERRLGAVPAAPVLAK
ncbi:MAG: Wzz/FepE/Etk N-terminal domain-containing protein [Acidimicrobiales bacterium]